MGEGQFLTPCQQIHMVVVTVTSLGVGGGCYSRTILHRDNKGSGQKY